LNQFYVVNGAIYLIASYDFFGKQTIVLRNKPTTIAMNSIRELQAHATDPILRGAPDYIGAHRIKHAHNLYFIRV